MLKVNNLTKIYKINKKQGFYALKGIDLTIDNESMVAIIGESGSGKSTFMNLISTLDKANGGYVELEGNKITFKSENAKANYRKDNIGFIFQSFNLINDITALENVAVALEIAGVEKEERYERATELLEMVGLQDHLHKKPGLLSGGQKQRVAIARALANDPKIILADEPTGSLDATTTVEIMRLLKSIAESGKKVIIVTHDMKVANYCERIVRMEDGKIISDEINEATHLQPLILPTPPNKSKRGLTFSGIFKLSSSAFKRRLIRNLLVSIGTAVAISSLLLINIVTYSIEGYLDDLAEMYGNNKVVITTIYASNLDENQSIEEEYDKLGIDDKDYITFEQVIPNFKLKNQGYSISNSRNDIFSASIMHPKQVDTFGSSDIIKGDKPKNNQEIVVSSKILSKFDLNVKNAVGSEIDLNFIDNSLLDKMQQEAMNNLISETFTISGILNEKSFLDDDTNIYFTYDKALEFGVVEDETEFESLTKLYEVSDPKYTQDLIDSTSMSFSNMNSSSKDLYYQSNTDVQEISGIKSTLKSTFNAFRIVLGVSIIVAAIMIAVMVYVSVLERMREIGVLRAVGAKKRDIRRMFYLESIGIGIISGLLAITFAIILGFIAVNIANDNLDFNTFGLQLKTKIQISSVLVTFIGAIILALFSSLLSIRLGLKVTPVEALKMK